MSARTRPDALLVAAAVTGLLSLAALIAGPALGPSWDGPPDPPSCSGGKD